MKLQAVIKCPRKKMFDFFDVLINLKDNTFAGTMNFFFPLY